MLTNHFIHQCFRKIPIHKITLIVSLVSQQYQYSVFSIFSILSHLALEFIQIGTKQLRSWPDIDKFAIDQSQEALCLPLLGSIMTMACSFDRPVLMAAACLACSKLTLISFYSLPSKTFWMILDNSSQIVFKPLKPGSTQATPPSQPACPQSLSISTFGGSLTNRDLPGNICQTISHFKYVEKLWKRLSRSCWSFLSFKLATDFCSTPPASALQEAVGLFSVQTRNTTKVKVPKGFYLLDHVDKIL